MLHYVRGDGGMIVVPKEELVRWAKEYYEERTAALHPQHSIDYVSGYTGALYDLLKALEAMGK